MLHSSIFKGLFECRTFVYTSVNYFAHSIYTLYKQLCQSIIFILRLSGLGRTLILLFTPCVEYCRYTSCFRIPTDREESNERNHHCAVRKLSSEKQFHKSDE